MVGISALGSSGQAELVRLHPRTHLSMCASMSSHAQALQGLQGLQQAALMMMAGQDPQKQQQGAQILQQLALVQQQQQQAAMQQQLLQLGLQQPQGLSKEHAAVWQQQQQQQQAKLRTHAQAQAQAQLQGSAAQGGQLGRAISDSGRAAGPGHALGQGSSQQGQQQHQEHQLAAELQRHRSEPVDAVLQQLQLLQLQQHQLQLQQQQQEALKAQQLLARAASAGVQLPAVQQVLGSQQGSAAVGAAGDASAAQGGTAAWQKLMSEAHNRNQQQQQQQQQVQALLQQMMRQQAGAGGPGPSPDLLAILQQQQLLRLRQEQGQAQAVATGGHTADDVRARVMAMAHASLAAYGAEGAAGGAGLVAAAPEAVGRRISDMSTGSSNMS